MPKLQRHYHFKLDFQKVDQHTGGKWLINGTKRRKDNQLQSLELPWNSSNSHESYIATLDSLDISLSESGIVLQLGQFKIRPA